MTTLDRLLEIGNHRCPCGASIAPRENAFARVLIECSECSSYCGGDDVISAFVTWLVLTGGPISCEVRPPDGERVLCEYATTDEWATKWRVCRITEGTAFSDGRRRDGYVRWFFIDRTPAIIRPWLESEVTT